MNHPRTIRFAGKPMRTLGFSLALALAAPAMVFAENTPENEDEASSALAEQVENGDLITTSGNGENTPASGDAGKDAIPDPLAAQETGETASPDERSDTLKQDSNEDTALVDSDETSSDDTSMADAQPVDAPTTDSSIADSTSTDAPTDNTMQSDTAVPDAMTDTEVAVAAGSDTTEPVSNSDASIDTSADAGITSKVETELASTSGVDVETRNGVITLTGEVPSFEEKMRVARAAAMVDGARQVDASQLDIADTAAVAASDEGED